MTPGDAPRVILALAAGVLLCGCVGLTKQQELSDYAGIWYGFVAEVDQGDPADRLTVLNADGTFVSYFRICRETIAVSSGTHRVGDQGASVAEFQTMIEAGHWSVAGDFETTVTETVSGSEVEPSNDYIEQYRITRRGPDEFDLVNVKTRVKLDLSRVGTKFRLPPNPCEA